MSPQLVDMNGDGHQDILVGTFEGVAYLIPGSENGFGKPEYILDSNGETILIAEFWDNEKEEWSETDRASQGSHQSQGHCTTVSAIDWDNDDDLDLLLGDHDEGRIYLRMNEGSKQVPKFVIHNEPLMVGDEQLKVPGGLANIKVVDWNKDGLMDLVCGGSLGGVYLFENSGKENAPKFSAAQTLVEALESVDSYSVIVPSKNGQPTMPGSSYHIDVADYDGDGDLDLLVGGQSTWQTGPVAKPTDAERVQLLGIETRIDQLLEKQEKLVEAKGIDDLDEEAMQKFSQSEEFQAIEKEITELVEAYEKIAPEPDGHGDFVWLYRRKG